MHRNNHHIRALFQSVDVGAHCANIGERHARIAIFPIAVALIVCIAKESEAHTMPDQNDSPVTFVRAESRANRRNSVLPQPTHGEFYSMRSAIPRMVIRRRNNSDVRYL